MNFDYEELKKQKQKVLASRERIEHFLSGKGITLDLPPSGFQTKATTLQELKVAAIMDEFTLNCYQPECRLLEISPTHFEQELDQFQPDMLFVESAWSGNHGLWEQKIAHGSKEYFALATYCKTNHIPIVFWNKEDPVHFEDFLIIAKTADFVFTTDIDMLPKYKLALQSDNVFHLHFAAQPTIHNPIEKYNRQDKFCFAGAYYRCYPKRAEIFDRFADIFLTTKGLDIYDREYGKKRSAYQFPSKYTPHILGKLEAHEIDKAYKGYTYGINMNTITDSNSMFARRVFEMMASNTITVGNFSKGLANYFGELTICTDDANELTEKLAKYCSTEANLHKYRLLGLRKILSEHLYEDRLNDIVEKVFNRSLKKELPTVTVISQAQNEKECQWIIKEFNNQTYENKKLLLFYQDKLITANSLSDNSENNAIHNLISEKVNDGYIAYFHPEDYYAPYYLYDLVHALRYCKAPAIGKNSFYYINIDNMQYHKGHLYNWGDLIILRCSLVNVNLISSMSFDSFLKKKHIEGASIFYTDEWNYCQNTLYNKYIEV